MVRFTFLTIAFLILFAGLAFSGQDLKVMDLSSKAAAAYVSGEIIVKFKATTDNTKIRSINSATGCASSYTSPYNGVSRLTVPSGSSVMDMVNQYRANPNVEYAEPNYIYTTLMVPNDPLFSYQWHMPMINVEQAWDQATGAGVIVAVVDAGVAYENYDIYAQAPDLANTNFVPGYDFVNFDSHPNDDNGHGTHVAGTIAQSTNNNLGVTGVAFGATIMPVKVLGADGSGSTTAIADGIHFAVDNGAKVINMSLGSRFTSTTMEEACTYAYNNGVTVVCAAGNSGRNILEYPAAYPQCISVSAVRLDSTLSYYSTYNSAVDVCAPGGDVTIDQDGDGYVDGVLQQTHDGTNFTEFSYYFYQGTSMASPHVAAAAALILSVDPTLTPAEVQAVLQSTAVDLGSSGWDVEYGYGMIDCNAALQSLNPTPLPPVAQYSGTPTSGTAPLTVNFTDLSTNSPTSWSWTFGDGGSSTAQNPGHVYASAGTYTVSLTATNAYGSDVETKTGYITVTAPNNYPPVADFSGTPTSGYAPLLVSFADLSTNNPTSWAWTFGDGGTSTAQNPNYTYTTPGTYTVTLTATNAYGSDAETKTGYITASEVVGGVMHVQNIAVTRIPSGRNCTGRGTITIYDAGASPVVGATVYVAVTGNTTQSLSGVTGSDGTVTLTTLKTKTCSGEWCFEVTNVTHASNSYNEGDNVVTEACESGWVYGAGIAMNEAQPLSFNLKQNYPNPFNPTTEISFTMPSSGYARLQIFNVAGQLVKTLVETNLSAGDHTFRWDASAMSSGIYLYRLETSSFSETKKMVLMK